MTRVRFCWDASCRAGRSSVTHILRLVFGLSDCPRPIHSKRTELWCRTLAVSPSECGSERRVCAAFMLDRRNPGNLLIASWPGSPPLFAAWPDECVRSRSRPGTGVRLDKVDLFNRRASRTSDPSGPPATVGGRFQERAAGGGGRKTPNGTGVILVARTTARNRRQENCRTPRHPLFSQFSGPRCTVVLTAQESDCPLLQISERFQARARHDLISMYNSITNRLANGR